MKKGDTVTVVTDRPELQDHRGYPFALKTGKVLAVQQGTGHLLIKLKGTAWPISFPASSCALLIYGRDY